MEFDCDNVVNNDNHKMDIKEEPIETLTQIKREYEELNNFHSETVFVSSHFAKESLSDNEMCNKIEIKEEPFWPEDVSHEIKQEMELLSATNMDLKNEIKKPCASKGIDNGSTWLLKHVFRNKKETAAHREVIPGNVAEDDALGLRKESICKSSEIASCFFMGTNSEENNAPNVTEPYQLFISGTLVKKSPHKCDVCSRTFKRPYMLKNHKLIHEGKRPHTCEVCNKSFTHLSNLRLHKLTHEGKKPYTCEFCNRSFTQISNLKRHKLMHEGPYTCDICNKGFNQVYHLNEHKLIHEGKRPFTCEFCKKSFTKLTYLQQHMKTKNHTHAKFMKRALLNQT